MTAQGSPDLLDTDVARRLLGTVAPARSAHTALDGTPRLLPMWFLWRDAERQPATFAGSRTVPALRARPIGLRPTRVGALDVRTRFPQALAGSAT